MSGISSSIGLISGIDTAALIDATLAQYSRPQVLAQRRIIQLQQQQASYLDLNTRLGSLKSAAEALRNNKAFEAVSAVSADEDVLTATATPGASLGTFSFLVDRTVSTQQLLTRGFADSDRTAVGEGTIVLEPDEGRLDRDQSLASLNAGNGITRGTIEITDASGASATIDLSKVATVSEVLSAINKASSIDVTARINGNAFELVDTSGGGGTLSVADGSNPGTVASLGLASLTQSGSTYTGTTVNSISDATPLDQLNDGNGVRVTTVTSFTTFSATDFTIKTRDGSTYSVNLGELFEKNDEDKFERTKARVGTVGELKARIEDATEGKVTLTTNADGNGFVLTDASTHDGSSSFEVVDVGGAAQDLGLLNTAATDTITGDAILASLNSTLLGNIRGGSGLENTDIQITDRAGNVYSFNFDQNASVSDLIRQIEDETAGSVTASLDTNGTGLILSDNTGSTASNLIITGGAATDLGIETDPAGVAANSVSSGRLQHRYVSESTLVANLNNGKGIGTGSFSITDSTGKTATISISSGTTTIKGVLKAINDADVGIIARINDNGDGIVIEEDPDAATGNLAITIADTTGGVAAALRIAGSAQDPDTDNSIDGSFETVIEVSSADTLTDVRNKLNNAGANVRASLLNDGSGTTPFRLSISSTDTGSAGRFTLQTTGSLNLAASTLSTGQNARVFYGSEDPATAILLTSPTNTVDGVVDGLSVDIKTASDTPVNVSTTRNYQAIEEGVQAFVDAYNDLVSRIDKLTDYDQDTEQRGPLLGEGAVNQLRQSLFQVLQQPARGISSQFSFLSQVGVRIEAGGQLALDAEDLREALEQDPEGVRDLFVSRTQEAAEPVDLAGQIGTDPGQVTSRNPDAANTFSSLGVTEQMAQLVDRYINSVNGIFTRRNRNFDTQIGAQEDRIQAIQRQLNTRRSVLEQQFANLERTLGQLQNQQSSLSSLGSLLG